MTLLRTAFIALLLVPLAGCARAPAQSDLKADLQAMLDTGYAPGLIEVVSARRANDFPLVRLSDGEAHVRYDATLRLKRGHRFGTWNQINAGTLVLLLGADPVDVTGISAAGNAAGDEIAVAGRLVYRAGADGLARAGAAAGTPAEGARGSVLLTDAAEGAQSEWETLRARVAASYAAALIRAWRRAAHAVAARAAREDGGYAIATGRADTPYGRLGRAAARAADAENIPFTNIAAGSAQEALDLLRSGRVSAAVIRNTDAALAAAGRAPYAARGPYHLRALAALYPEPVHVIVKADSPLGSPADLFGKHVGVAGTARVDAAEAEAILRGHGVSLAALAAPLVLAPPAEALAHLVAGAFDALVMTAPLPNAALHAFAARGDVRLLPFDSDAIALMTSGLANHAAVTVPAHTYPGQTRPLAAVAAVAMLVSVETVPAREAADLLAFMLTRVDYLRRGSLAGIMIGKTEARPGGDLPWHDGARLFFDGPAAAPDSAEKAAAAKT